jgi:hypothetical protein
MKKMRKTQVKEKENENENEDINPEEIKNELNDIELDGICKTNGFDKLYNFGISCCSFILKTTIFLFKISGIYLLWICLHYFSAHLYIKFCVPNSVIGFIMSPFMISTPHCQGLRWIVYNAANIINHMWILIGAWIYSILWIVNKDNNSNMNNVL